MSKTTLIVHPKDSSTIFLNDVYAPISNKTVIQGGITKKELIYLIEAHDRIMMMGHGSPSGLFAIGQFPETSLYIIDNELISILEKKQDNVFIWCYASSFIDNTNLPGFATGMFISEVGEALFCGLKGINQQIVDESNSTFVREIAKSIHLDSKSILKNMLQSDYNKLAAINPVAKYNFDRIKHNELIHK
jgi:hypothetical protein